MFSERWCCFSISNINFLFDISTLVDSTSKVTKRLYLFHFFFIVDLYSVTAIVVYSHNLWLILVDLSLSPSSLGLSVFSCCFIWLKKQTSSANSMFFYAVVKVQCIPRFSSVTTSSTSQYPVRTWMVKRYIPDVHLLKPETSLKLIFCALLNIWIPHTVLLWF